MKVETGPGGREGGREEDSADACNDDDSDT